ncbi:MAG TPA: hypothetical protein VGY54_20580 [Polyangiaceae bacterium]|nr:hypothetical protein [Polyangiaceae bacterium]
MMTCLAAWAFIGAAAALAACIWPFRRGFLGIAVNIGAGVAGAIGATCLGVALGLSPSPRSPRALFLAAIGAFALLGVVHAIWHARHHGAGSRSRLPTRP